MSFHRIQTHNLAQDSNNSTHTSFIYKIQFLSLHGLINPNSQFTSQTLGLYSCIKQLTQAIEQILITHTSIHPQEIITSSSPQQPHGFTA